MSVRNFWIDLEVGGRKTTVNTGPRGKEGGFTLTVKVRENGDVSAKEMHIHGYVIPDGNLHLSAFVTGTKTPRKSLEIITKR